MQYIICHDGTLQGDCFLDPTIIVKIPDNVDVSIKDNIKPYAIQEIASVFSCDADSEDVIDEWKFVKGWWVVPDTTVKLIEKLWNVVECGGDSSVYDFQSVLKHIANETCTAKYGKLK